LTLQRDRSVTQSLYARSGVREYGIADPRARTFEILVLESETYKPVEPDGDGLLASRAIPCLHGDPNQVFSLLD
jgi:Uma2 family endonuclease